MRWLVKHRICTAHGLGVNTQVWLNNEGDFTSKVQFGDAAMKYLGVEGVDFQIEKDRVSIGIEPTYQYDKLKIIVIHQDKRLSSITDGIAWGHYGSDVVVKRKYYHDYKYNSKFVKFVDQWHSTLWGSK